MTLTNKDVKSKYLNEILDKFKANPADETLSSSEKILLHKAFKLEGNIISIMKKMEDAKQELDALTAKLKELEQSLVYERGQMTGTVEALLSLKSEENTDN